MSNFVSRIKKGSFLAIFIFVALFLTACGNNIKTNNNISYKNKDLQFSLQLPENFKYFQTQRVQAKNFIDIEFFVPTSDQSYGTEVAGYAKPFVIRVFDNDNLTANSVYEKIGTGNGKIYTVKFWKRIPQDWQKIWSQKMEDNLKNNFKVY